MMQEPMNAFADSMPVDFQPARPRGADVFAMLPELSPADEKSANYRKITIESLTLTQDSIREEPTDFRARPERTDIFARLTVYALNAIIMLFAFPIGFALLIFNILGGENLRTTAHALGLTGLAMALSSTSAVAQMLTSI